MNARTVLWRVAQLALVVLVTWGIVRALAPELTKVTLDDFARQQPNWWLLFLSLVVLLVFYLFHAWLWRLMAVELGQKPLAYRNALHVYFVSGLGRYIPGRIWQIAGLAVLAQRAGISAVAATAGSVLAQLAFITTGLLFAALLLPSAGMTAPIIALVVVAAALIAGYHARHWLGRRVERARPVVDILDRLGTAKVVKWWIGYAFSWLVLGAAFVLLAMSFVALDARGQLYVAGAMAASYLGGQLAFFSVAGLGVREAVLGTLLLNVMPAPAALVVSVTSRIWFTVGELLPIALGKRST